MTPVDDDPLARLLRHARPASPPPAEVTRRTHAAVVAAWQRIQAQRQQRRRVLAIAASVVLAASASLFVYSLRGPAEAGRVAALRGDVQRDQGRGEVAALAQGGSLARGDHLRAGPDASLLLRRPGGATLRLAANSELVVRSADQFELLRGAVYLDIAPDNSAREHLSILTRAGELRHLGTRFAVIVQPTLVRVAVREGRVELAQSQSRTTIAAGEQAQVNADGRLQRQPLARAPAQWDWTDIGARRSLAIDRRALFDVLQDIGAALDVPVRYATPQMEAQARAMQLHGPSLTLPAADALDGVLLATHLQAQRAPDVIQIVPR